MEEWVGERWHQWVSRRAAGGHAEAAVTLAEVTPAVRLLLHAAGATQRLATATPLPVAGAAPGGSAWRAAGSACHWRSSMPMPWPCPNASPCSTTRCSTATSTCGWLLRLRTSIPPLGHGQ